MSSGRRCRQQLVKLNFNGDIFSKGGEKLAAFFYFKSSCFFWNSSILWDGFRVFRDRGFLPRKQFRDQR
jgi:hypothetical protein